MDTVKKLSAGYKRILQKCSSASIVVSTYIALMIITLATVWFSVTSAVNNYLNQQTDVLGSSLATQAAFNATQSILTNDLLSLNVLLNRLVVSDSILGARVYNKKDELLAQASQNGTQTSSENELRPSDAHRVYSSPIRFRDEIVGHVLITLDKSGSQSTLAQISNLMIGLGIILTAITGLVLLLVMRRLFLPITMASDAVEAFTKGTNNAPLPKHSYREATELADQISTLQTLELATPIATVTPQTVSQTFKEDEQYEIDFDTIIKESERESCALYIQFNHLEKWREDMSPLQVANLLTPLYRAIFLSAEHFHGQVHQHESDNVIILFQEKDCDDNLFMDAASCAELVRLLLEKLSNTDLYQDVPDILYHMGLVKGCEQVSKMFEENYFAADQVTDLIQSAKALSLSESSNKLVMGDDIVTRPEIQNRIILSLPEIIDLEDGSEHLAYTVKDLSEKYRKRVNQVMDELSDDESADSV